MLKKYDLKKLMKEIEEDLESGEKKKNKLVNKMTCCRHLSI